VRCWAVDHACLGVEVIAIPVLPKHSWVVHVQYLSDLVTSTNPTAHVEIDTELLGFLIVGSSELLCDSPNTLTLVMIGGIDRNIHV